jgi:diguanylate cyclase (GGDEF)-like protein/PAS domain S-box-containing protein
MINNKIIGIITRHLDGSLFGGLIYHINEKAVKKGYRVLALKTTRSVSEFTIPLATKVAAGWFVMQDPLHPGFLQELRTAGAPIVGLNHVSADYPYVQFDNQLGMEQSVDHLIQHGHQRIAFMGNLNYSNTSERFLGYQSALRKHGIAFDPELVFQIGSFSQFEGSLIAEKFIRGEIHATAIASSGDFSSMGFLERIRAAGFSVPQDIAIIGYDDIPLTVKTNPPITSIKVPVEEMAEKALDMLIQMMEQGKHTTENHKINTELVIRNSCGCHSETSQPAHDEDYLKAFNRLTEVLDVNRQFLTHLAEGNMEKIKSWSWLEALRSPWGCFGQWTKEGSQDYLISMSQLNGTPLINGPTLMSQPYTSAHFPIIDQIPESAMEDPRNIVALHPISANGREWGILTLVQTIDKSLMYYKSNTVTHSFGLIANALERAELFDTIQDFNQRLEIVSETATDGIFIWNLDSWTIDWNQGAHRILGDTLNQEQASFVNMIFPMDRLNFHNAWKNHLDLNKPFRLEFRIKGASGDYIWVEASGKAVRDSTGRPSRVIGSLRDITERKLAESQITYMAYHDALTGLPNRAMFYEQLAGALKEDKPLAIILVDLDHFKSVNDNYGHQAGDELLNHVARHLIGSVGSKGLVSRLAGDEFIVLMKNTHSIEQVNEVCDAILNNVHEPFIYLGHKFHITVSMGISMYPQDGRTADMLIKNADTAMYEAKSAGKNHYKSFSI